MSRSVSVGSSWCWSVAFSLLSCRWGLPGGRGDLTAIRLRHPPGVLYVDDGRAFHHAATGAQAALRLGRLDPGTDDVGALVLITARTTPMLTASHSVTSLECRESAYDQAWMSRTKAAGANPELAPRGAFRRSRGCETNRRLSVCSRAAQPGTLAERPTAAATTASATSTRGHGRKGDIRTGSGARWPGILPAHLRRCSWRGPCPQPATSRSAPGTRQPDAEPRRAYANLRNLMVRHHKKR